MAIDWAKIFRANKGQWVALQDDETTVIATAGTAKEALHLSRQKGFVQPILAKMPHDLEAFIG